MLAWFIPHQLRVIWYGIVSSLVTMDRTSAQQRRTSGRDKNQGKADYCLEKASTRNGDFPIFFYP